MDTYPSYFTDDTPLGFFNENLTQEKFNSMNNDDIKKVVLKHVLNHGYEKGSYGHHNNNGTSYRGSPTVAEVIRILDLPDITPYMASDSELEEVDRYFGTLTPSGQFVEFQRKIKEIWDKDHLVKDDLNMLCAACNSFIKQKEYEQRQNARREREAQHQAEVQSSGNVWAGEIGQEIEFKIAQAKIATYIQPHSYYASSYPLWKIVDTDGRTYSWGDTKGETELEPGMKIHAKIKDLREFRGIKETQIWKLKIIGGSAETQLGFFRESIGGVDSETWLKNKFGLHEKELAKLCDANWDECDFELYWYDPVEGHEVAISTIFVDANGRNYFDSLEDAVAYYGYEFVVDFIKGLIEWAKEDGIFFEIVKPEPRLGFFNK